MKTEKTAFESTTEVKFLAVSGDNSRVPILSLSPTLSSRKHPSTLFIFLLNSILAMSWFLEMHNRCSTKCLKDIMTPNFLVLNAHKDPSYKEVEVGVILDMESGVGKVIYRCIAMAISDFYIANPHYRTRIVFNTRDYKGEPLRALSSAVDLFDNTEVQAIIGPESIEARFLEVLEHKTNKPIFSLSTSTYSDQNPYLLRITQDETTELKGIASMVESFKANNVIVICEDTTTGRQMASYMISSFQEKNIHVTYTSLISTSKVDEELHKVQTMQNTVFVMHASPSLASNIFSRAKELGMMDEGYMWISTSKAMNLLDSMDVEAIESMQGVVGFKSYFPSSKELHSLISKLRKEHYALNPFMDFKEVDFNGIWAYDAVYALAMAIERVQTIRDTSLLNQILRVDFHGLGGEFRFINGGIISKAMEVVNVIGKGDRTVGYFMMSTNEFVKEIGKPNSSYSNQGLQSIIWPGGTTRIPKRRRMSETNGKKLRILFPGSSKFQNLAQLSVDPRTNVSVLSGFCGDVFNAAFNSLDYGVDIEVVSFSSRDGVTYNDIIQKIYLKEYDVAVGDFTITANRSHYVDFTLPFTDLGIGIVSRNAKNNMWIFLDPLSPDLWITSSCFFLFLGFVIWFIEHHANEEFQGSLSQQIGTALWFAFSTLVYSHREKVKSNLSKFVVTVWVFVVLVLTSSYIATLSSFLTIQQIGMKEMSIRFQGTLSPVAVVYNKMDVIEAWSQKLYAPEDYAKALTSGQADAIVSEIFYIKSFLALYSNSDFSLIATALTTNGFGFAFQKGSALAREMSTQIAKMREDGTLKALEDKWMNHQSAMMSKTFSSPSPKILNLYGLRGLFIISGVSMVSALVLSVILLVREKWRMKDKMKVLRLFPFLILTFLSFQSLLTAHEDPSYKDIKVGVILDMESGVGMVIYQCINMAISDFYTANPHYNTRIVFITRDTKGEPPRALSAVRDLLENTEVQAIIGPESTIEARFLEGLTENANKPILSFSTSPFSNRNPYIVGIAQDETTQFKGIASMVELFKATNVIVIGEDTKNGREMATYMVDVLQEKSVHVTGIILISTFANNEQVSEELHKLQTMQAMVFVVHTSPSLASKVFLRAKDLGMMDEGYTWISTSKNMNLLDSMDAEAIEAMQGVVGFRSYFPSSKKLHSLVSKLRKEYYALNPFMDFKDLDHNGIWAYDVVYALVMALERVETTKLASKDFDIVGTSLLNRILSVNFHGLGGEFKIMNGRIISKAMEVVNVIGKGDRRVGLWTATDPKTNLSDVKGFCVDVFNAAFNSLDFGVGVEFVPFVYKDDHDLIGITYNDMLDKIYLKEYDVAIGDITITPNRSLYVDFTFPFTDLGVGTAARYTKNSMWIFLDPLSAGLWITREKLQSNLSRFVVSVWVFVVLVLTSSYTATLSSMLTIEQIGLKDTSLGFHGYSPIGGFLFRKLKPVDINLLNLSTPEDWAKALTSGRVDAMVAEILYIKSFLALYPAADFSLIATASTTNGFGFIVCEFVSESKGSDFQQVVSEPRARLEEEAAVLRVEKGVAVLGGRLEK
ncbi:hypothetical protein LXL04_036698 [Taraxacum kok-saghyz]